MAEDKQTIVTPYGRLSFPTLVKARAFKKGDTEKFNASILFPKQENIGQDREDGKPFSPWNDFRKHDLSKLEAIVEEYVDNRFPGNKRPKKLKLPFKDGDEESWAGYPGHTFIRMSSMYPPTLIKADKSPVTGDDISRVFYAGCWVRAIVNIFDYNNTGNIGVSFGLQGLQFLRDDNTFQGGAIAPDAFDDLPEDDLAPDDLDDMM